MQESKDSETGLLLINPPLSSASAKSAWRDLFLFHSLTETVLILIRMLIILPSQGSMQYIAMVRIYHPNTIQLSLVILLYSVMVLVALLHR